MTTTPEATKGVPRIEGNPAPTLRADHNALADWSVAEVGTWVANVAALPLTGNWPGRRRGVTADQSSQEWNGTEWLVFDSKPQTYTPTFNSFVPGNSVMQATYTRRGKTIRLEGSVNVGTTSTFGASPQLVLPFPGIAKYAATGTNYILGVVGLLDRGTQFFNGTAFTQGSSTFVQLAGIGVNGALATISSTFPFTWAANDEFSWAFEYQVP